MRLKTTQMNSNPLTTEELREYGSQLQHKFHTGVLSMQARLEEAEKVADENAAVQAAAVPDAGIE